MSLDPATVAGRAYGETAQLEPPEQVPSLLDAIEEQFGLKLNSVKGRVELIVADHVERPSEN